MPDIYLVLVVLGLALALCAVSYGASTVRNLEQRVSDLERRANPASKHDLRYLERQDIGEATLFDLARMRQEFTTALEYLEYATGRARHVASGGSPDDPPTQWKKE